MELQTGMLSTLAELYLCDVTWTAYDVTIITVTYFDVIGIGAWLTVYTVLPQIFCTPLFDFQYSHKSTV